MLDGLEAYSGPRQTSKVELFGEIVNGQKPLTIFTKSFILNMVLFFGMVFKPIFSTSLTKEYSSKSKSAHAFHIIREVKACYKSILQLSYSYLIIILYLPVVGKLGSKYASEIKCLPFWKNIFKFPSFNLLMFFVCFCRYFSSYT